MYSLRLFAPAGWLAPCLALLVTNKLRSPLRGVMTAHCSRVVRWDCCGLAAPDFIIYIYKSIVRSEDAQPVLAKRFWSARSHSFVPSLGVYCDLNQDEFLAAARVPILDASPPSAVFPSTLGKSVVPHSSPMLVEAILLFGVASP